MDIFVYFFMMSRNTVSANDGVCMQIMESPRIQPYPTFRLPIVSLQ